MEQIYEISKVITLVTYTRYEINEKGEKVLKHSQTKPLNGLFTKDELIKEAESRCLPEENIKVVIDENLGE